MNYRRCVCKKYCAVWPWPFWGAGKADHANSWPGLNKSLRQILGLYVQRFLCGGMICYGVLHSLGWGH